MNLSHSKCGTAPVRLGKVKIKVTNIKTKKKWNVNYVVVEDNSYTPLLSCRAAESMGLVTVNYNAFDVCTVKSDEINSEFPYVFDEKLGSLPGGPGHLTLEVDPEP